MMIGSIAIGKYQYEIAFDKPLDISIPLRAGVQNVNAFYIPPVNIQPFQIGSFVGAIEAGGSCNVNTITVNPHGNGTHTETMGHISTDKYHINDCMKKFFFTATVVSVTPQPFNNGDSIITKASMVRLLENLVPTEALVIRTLPNTNGKLTAQYSGTNPTYFEPEALAYIAALGVQHLLVDLPSVDREEDGGLLAAHKAYWSYDDNPRTSATITELIYVPAAIEDGIYLLNLQIISLENDASPSKPILYQLIQQ